MKAGLPIKWRLGFFVFERGYSMKKIQLISILIVVLLFTISGYAGTQKMKIVSMPKVRVEYTHKVVSAFAYVNREPKIVMTVPSGKIFILTDIVTLTGGQFGIFEDDDGIFEDDETKTRVNFRDGNYSIHFRTGILFSSESNIVIDSLENNNVTISGYLLKD
jgi:hypothetical protein